jgi:hypothetical protein
LNKPDLPRSSPGGQSSCGESASPQYFLAVGRRIGWADHEEADSLRILLRISKLLPRKEQLCP